MSPKEFVKTVEAILLPYADAALALPMQKYMKDNFSFLGIKKPKRHELTVELIRSLKKDITEEWLLNAMELLWKKEEREYQYMALELVKKYKRVLSKTGFDKLEYFITTKSWWDTVDTLSDQAYGAIVKKHPGLKKKMKAYASHDNMWLRRLAILFQLSYKEDTDEAFLFEVCRLRMREKEFFIRKAIGWALRQYSKTKPKAVKKFVDENRASLSGLSIREALKHV